jgi:hypothetical protein
LREADEGKVSFGQVRAAKLLPWPPWGTDSVLSTTASYQLLAADLPRTLKRTAAQPVVARESEYYLANIGKVKSIEDFLANDRLFTYAMKAFGLGDMSYAKAFMRKAMEGGIDAEDSFANTLSDKRYRDFVTAFNFNRFGEATTTFTRAQHGAVDRYVRQALEENAGAENEGVRLALYFERKAPTLKSIYDVLADPALLEVVQTALGIPAVTAMASIDVQAKMISARLEVADLADPEKLETFIKRFTSLWEVRNPSQPAATPAMLISQPRELGIGADILSALQGLKLGGL